MRADRRALFTSLAFHGALLAVGCAVILSPAVPAGNGAPGGETASFILDTGAAPDGADTEEAPEPAAVAEASTPLEPPKPALTAPSVETQEVIRPIVTTALPGPGAVVVPSGALPGSGIAKESASQKKRGEGRGKRGLTSGGAGGGNGGRFVAAQYDRCPPPPYPAEAQRKQIGGVVLLFVMVDEAGNPSAVQLRRTSGHAILDEAALRAVRRWRFIPASAGGKPIVAKLEVPIRFVPS